MSLSHLEEQICIVLKGRELTDQHILQALRDAGIGCETAMLYATLRKMDRKGLLLCHTDRHPGQLQPRYQLSPMAERAIGWQTSAWSSPAGIPLTPEPSSLIPHPSSLFALPLCTRSSSPIPLPITLGWIDRFNPLPIAIGCCRSVRPQAWDSEIWCSSQAHSSAQRLTFSFTS